MTADVQAPAAPPRDPFDVESSTSPRRRPRRLAVGAAIALVLGLAAGGTWVARYDPLARGSIGWATPHGVHARAIDVSWALPDAPRIVRIPARPGLDFRYRFSIRNDGPLAITVRDVGVPAERAGDVVTRRPVRVMLDDLAGPSGSGWIPFRSFTLAPGGEASVEMEAELHACSIQRGSTLAWGGEDITYTVFGITRHAYFSPGVALALVGTPACSLP